MATVPYLDDKTILNRLSQSLKRKIQEIKSAYYEKYLKSLTATKESNYSLWKATKDKRKSTKQVPPLKKPDGSWAKSCKEKAEIFADHLKKKF